MSRCRRVGCVMHQAARQLWQVTSAEQDRREGRKQCIIRLCALNAVSGPAPQPRPAAPGSPRKTPQRA